MHTHYWNTLEKRAPMLFLLGGAGVVTHAAIMAGRAFTNFNTPPDLFAPTGHLIGFIALLGLYPAIVNRKPNLARVALLIGAVSVVNWLVLTVAQFLVVAGPWQSPPELLPGPFFVFLLVGSIIAYLLFGISAWQAGSPRSVWLLVLGPGFFLAVLLLNSVFTGASAADGVFIGGGTAASMLALGYRLRSWSPATLRTTDAAAVTPG